jgi:hypothetical protein
MRFRERCWREIRYRGENLVENSVNEGCRGWDLEDIAGDSLKPAARPAAKF